MQKLIYVMLGIAILLSVSGLVLETGHAHLCKLEIQRTQKAFERDLIEYPKQVAVRRMASQYESAAWVLAIPAGMSCELTMEKQHDKETTKTPLQTFRIPPGNVAEIVAVQIVLATDATGVNSFQLKTSRAGQLDLPIPRDEVVLFPMNAITHRPRGGDLFDTKQVTSGRAASWFDEQGKVHPQTPLEDELMLMTEPFLKGGNEEVIYGLKLSTGK